MKNLKKLMAVIVVVVMLTTSLLTAGAAGNQYLVEAQSLYDLGLYKGVSTTTFDPDLESALNREQGVSMLVRMFGREADAEALSSSEVASILGSFSDAASISDWARNSVALAIKESLVQGRPDGTFGPADALLGKDYATLILRALGYEVTATSYHTAAADLVDKGGLTPAMALLYNDKPLIRDDFVGITFASLNAKDTTGMTIIAALVEANVVDEEKAIAAGLYQEQLNIKKAKAAVAALEAAAAKDLSVNDNIKAAEALVADAKAAVAKIDDSTLEASLAAAEATIATARKAFNDKVSLEDAAEKAVAALEAAAAKDLAVAANLTAAEAAVAPAEAAVAAVKDTTVNAALTARITAAKATISAGKVYFEAKAAVDAYKVAPYTTLAEITAAEALEAAANTAVAKVADAAAKAALEADIAAQKALVVAAKVSLSTVEVEGVKINNLKSFVVTFTKALDKDTVKKENIKVDDATNYEFVLSADKKAITIELNSAVQQSDEIKVAFKNLKDADGNKIADYEKKFVAVDVTQPVLSNVEFVNNKKLKAVFTEPVQADSAGVYITTDVSYVKVLIDDGINFAKFTPVPAENIVYIEFLNPLSDGTHTVTVSKVKDYAGFQMIATSFTFTSVTDDTAPVAVSVNVKANNKLEVVFNEDLDTVNAGVADWEIKQTGDTTNYAANATIVYKDKKATITFGAGEKFDVRATLGFTVKYRNIKDVFANKNSEWTTLSSSYADDMEKPYVVSYEVAKKNQINITFSETVNIAGNEAKFKLYNSKNELVTTGTAAMVKYNKDNDKIVEINFTGLANVDVASYTVKIDAGLPDSSIRANEMAKFEFSITSIDTKSPAITSVVAEGSGDTRKFVIRFSEVMDKDLVTDLSNYFVGQSAVGVVASNIKDAAISTSDYKVITLKLPKSDDHNTDVYDRLAFGLMKDASGNLLSSTATLSNPAIVAQDYSSFVVGAADLEAQATGKNTIVVKYKGAKKDTYTFTAASAASFTVNNLGGYNMGVIAAQISADGKSVTLTLSRAMTADTQLKVDNDVYAIDLSIIGTATKDINGQAIAVANIAIADKIKATMNAPVLKTGTTDTIAVTFDEPVSVISGLTNGLFTIKAGDTTYVPTVDYTITAVSGGFEIQIIKTDLTDKEVTITLTNPDYLKDGNNNSVIAAAAKTLKITTPAS